MEEPSHSLILMPGFATNLPQTLWSALILDIVGMTAQRALKPLAAHLDALGLIPMVQTLDPTLDARDIFSRREHRLGMSLILRLPPLRHGPAAEFVPIILLQRASSPPH